MSGTSQVRSCCLVALLSLQRCFAFVRKAVPPALFTTTPRCLICVVLKGQGTPQAVAALSRDEQPSTRYRSNQWSAFRMSSPALL